MNSASPFQRFEMTYDDIEKLMRTFYAAIRAHPELGPIFNRAIGTDPQEWRHHEAKIAGFWSNAILMDRNYQGNPMRVHFMNHEVQPEHFAIWLNIFHDSAKRVLTPEKAENICALADRIGAGLSFGLQSMRNNASEPPKLR